MGACCGPSLQVALLGLNEAVAAVQARRGQIRNGRGLGPSRTLSHSHNPSYSHLGCKSTQCHEGAYEESDASWAVRLAGPRVKDW